ncbi:LisH domain-containing protein C29A3.03c [Candida viswanathii]|uniref:LisH domain-containing protein C29A3.03c n=1 Tax=Candida viswanathii TaxID=5486 RepID=A0A367Y763_9ASCO|nr:LisH domain-containing protein C29A3.03c [Candida viswanathii]
MTSLLDTLSSEVTTFNQSGVDNLNDLLQDSNEFLTELRSIESDLVEEVNNEEKGEISNGSAKSSRSIDQLSKLSDKWYKSSISRLKSYNSANNKFTKNILNNSRFNIDLDDAYTYPLLLNSYPDSTFAGAKHGIFPTNGATDQLVSNGGDSALSADMQLKKLKSENREELIRTIILHLLKVGQCDIVPEILKELPPDSPLVIDGLLSEKFAVLNKIVDNIVNRHDLNMALNWFDEKYNERVAINSADGSGSLSSASTTATTSSNSHPSLGLVAQLDSINEIEFKFHMLQFTILLNGKDSSFTLDDALAAYLYSKDNFSRFFKDYINEISPLMTLLLFKTDKDTDTNDDFSKKHMLAAVKNFITKMKQGFYLENEQKRRNTNHGSEVQFVGELLSSFEKIHENTNLFVNLANEFISEYCKDLKLSNDSSLFQSILAGHIYLPSFYKYNQIQLKLKKLKTISNEKVQEEPAAASNSSNNNTNPSHSENQVTSFVAPYQFELPFQLPDSNRFLFKYHPIFICPVSREQSIPITETLVEAITREDNSVKKRKYVIENSSMTQVVVLNYCQHLALRDSIWQLSKKGMEIFKCHYCYKKHKYSDITDAYFIDL